MHIHGNSINFQIAGINSYAAIETEANRQRAAEVRRKLMKIATDLEGESSPEESFLVDQWRNSQHGRGRNEDQYHASAEGEEPGFGEETGPSDPNEVAITSCKLAEIA
jgi:hypothetical protein